AALAEYADEKILTTGQRARLDRLAREQSNLRAPREPAQGHQPTLRLRPAGGLGHLSHTRGNGSAGHRWLTGLPPAAPKRSLPRARGLLRLSSVAGHSQEAIEQVEEALAIFRASDERTEAALALVGLGWLQQLRGESARARPLLTEALAL